ncbi:hypothetical protein OUZ56_016527 [Daphnia magna]|uniref:Uncharacterized protein n=1 Tax=Daphnia magna TaxID=35525 RepID=A0ABR0AQS2_9CRUS|nr:hypothetical protein OUZ56_016527 [Daphnia magna]
MNVATRTSRFPLNWLSRCWAIVSGSSSAVTILSKRPAMTFRSRGVPSADCNRLGVRRTSCLLLHDAERGKGHSKKAQLPGWQFWSVPGQPLRLQPNQDGEDAVGKKAEEIAHGHGVGGEPLIEAGCIMREGKWEELICKKARALELTLGETDVLMDVQLLPEGLQDAVVRSR